MKSSLWGLLKDGPSLPSTAPVTGQERIAMDSIVPPAIRAPQVTHVTVQQDFSDPLAARKVQGIPTAKAPKVSHPLDQDDLVLTTPQRDASQWQVVDTQAQTSSPFLLSLAQPDGKDQVLVAQVESALVGAASDTTSAILAAQDATHTTSDQEEKDDDKFWLLTFWGGTLVGVLPLLVLSGGFTNGSPSSGASNVSSPTAPTITSLTDDVGTITGVVANGGRSDDTQLVVRVSLTGTGALANDSVQLYDNTSPIAGVVTKVHAFYGRLGFKKHGYEFRMDF